MLLRFVNAAMYFLPIAQKKQAEVSKLVEASALN